MAQRPVPVRLAIDAFREPWAASYYQRKLAEGKTHSMALRALANIWVRIMYRMWVSETCYQAETFEAARLAHAKRVA